MKLNSLSKEAQVARRFRIYLASNKVGAPALVLLKAISSLP